MGRNDVAKNIEEEIPPESNRKMSHHNSVGGSVASDSASDAYEETFEESGILIINNNNTGSTGACLYNNYAIRLKHFLQVP